MTVRSLDVRCVERTAGIVCERCMWAITKRYPSDLIGTCAPPGLVPAPRCARTRHRSHQPVRAHPCSSRVQPRCEASCEDERAAARATGPARSHTTSPRSSTVPSGTSAPSSSSVMPEKSPRSPRSASACAAAASSASASAARRAASARKLSTTCATRPGDMARCRGVQREYRRDVGEMWCPPARRGRGAAARCPAVASAARRWP